MNALNSKICECRRCPRLVEWRESVAAEKRKAFADEQYWGKAVPNFGDEGARKLIVGLAPAAHGANRTGRMFTGDRSGDWLYRALHKAGIASQPTSESRNDGLTLTGAYITAVCHCAPPDNKPSNDEIAACQPFLLELLNQKEWESILCLGSIAWKHTCHALGIKPMPSFLHGATYLTKEKVLLVGSYHPSQQNTFTGRLTEQMLDEAVRIWSNYSL